MKDIFGSRNILKSLSDSEDSDLGHARSADRSLCTCSFCASIPRLQERTCCQ